MNLPLSHPTKPLIDHLIGMLKIINKNNLSVLAVVFHDLGKLSKKFQEKIIGKYTSGYSHHSYISVYLLMLFFIKNKKAILNNFPEITDSNFKDYMVILSNVIIGHHSYLRNINNFFKGSDSNGSEWDSMITYLQTDNVTKTAMQFLDDNNSLLMECAHDIVYDNPNSNLSVYISYANIDEWSNNALPNYFKTLLTFSELINADRRDAAGNYIYIRTSTRTQYNYALANNLSYVFRQFAKKSTSKLSNIRTELRQQANENIKGYLNSCDDRVFTLTAPTGSGKTLMMLDIANQILEHKGRDKYDIMYCLPFISIIDQTCNIVNNDLRIDTLNFTSTSDTSDILQSMMEENKSDNTNILRYAFSENSFDHPFIITTFNQLFETLLSNKTSKAMRLTNFKNRIFLIDEYQAMQSNQYYVMLKMLQYFCKHYDSYAIISTATMPYFDINLSDTKNADIRKVFGSNRNLPRELLGDISFKPNLFNRYTVDFIGKHDLLSITNTINKENDSTLVIVNTISTSRHIFEELKRLNNFDKYYLINSNITPKDRQTIISNIKKDLASNVKTLVVSTQVVEAGVDISFPVLYRDAAPIPSINQGAGRCNRSWEYTIGRVYIFLYKDATSNKNQYDCDMVYQGQVSNKLKDDISNNAAQISENQFNERCKKYFYGIAQYAEQGVTESKLNISQAILAGRFEDLGKYVFIDKQNEKYTVYVGCDEKLWNTYQMKYIELKECKHYNDRDIAAIEFNSIKSIILQSSVSVSEKIFKQLDVDTNMVYSVYKLNNSAQYSTTEGIII